ncbi:AbrB/MazE/SpoVT family DNA-binding domain-containing protein [Anaeromassilibacillus senegalensis]|uniref:AbrB/MazE/SpoVT family DNA-binding domain-containing protein n=1 Tax=Anaeromassilibacillus senegalensis TaxID=1673717 RepID=UPI000938C248|nr:AbrB/MazE/SpoVT family DNA-binding domain-containing protein [Anaeromassilibacillus senegalensis]
MFDKVVIFLYDNREGSEGMDRTIDGAGRIVIPIEYRRFLQIEEKDQMEISLHGNQIVMQKATKRCVFCGGKERLLPFEQDWVCQACQIKLTAVYYALLE